MRADTLWPRTWLLATVAGWSLVVAVLALFGLGAHIAPLKDDPSAVPRLPALPKPAEERLGPLSQYSQLVTRPPFYESRQPQPYFLTDESAEQPAAFDYVLSSVLITPGLRMAILQPAQGGEGIRIKLGEASSAAPQWTLVGLEPRSAVFEGPEGRRTLELRVFDGTGAQAPTAVGGPAPGAPPMAGPAPPARTDTGAASPEHPPLPQPPPSTAPASPAEAETSPPMTTEQQMDAIRKRIEARRAQMRQQQGGQPPARNP